MQALGWTVATAGPAAPIITGFSPDSGTVGDDITNATVLILSGTTEVGSTVTVYDGSNSIGTATVDANGNWSFTTGTLSNGVHGLTATATDANGTSAASSALNVTVDTVAPAAPTVALANDTGSSGSDHITNNATLALTGIETGAKVEYSIDGGSTWSTSAPTAAQLAQGSNTVDVRQTDVAGNVSATTAFTFTLDTTAPSETISSTIGTNTGLTTTISSGGLTKDNTLTLSGTVSDANGVSSVHVFDGATDLGVATVVSGTWSLTTAALSNGAHSFTAVATDTAGNTTTTAAVTATVDTTAPTGGTPALATGSDSGSSASDNITKVTNPTFQVALNSTVAAGDTVELLLGGLALAHDVTHTVTAADITAGYVSLAVTAGDLGADGAKSITAKFTDAAGNTSTTAADGITLDTSTAAPVVALTSEVGFRHLAAATTSPMWAR